MLPIRAGQQPFRQATNTLVTGQNPVSSEAGAKALLVHLQPLISVMVFIAGHLTISLAHPVARSGPYLRPGFQ
jgi:hypothetical protein